MKKDFNFFKAAYILPILLVLFSGFLFVKLFTTGILPRSISILFIVFILIYVAISAFAIVKKKKALTITLAVLSVLLVAVVAYGTVALNKVTKTLDSISVEAPKETTMISVVTLSESAYSDIETLAGKNVALCDTYESKKVAENMFMPLSVMPVFYKADHQMYLVDALLDGQADAIIIDDAYLEIVSEFEGYEEFNNKINVLDTFEVVHGEESLRLSFDHEIKYEVVEEETTEETENSDSVSEPSWENDKSSNMGTANTGSSSTTLKPVTKVNTGGIANSATGAHTTSLSWGDDIITAKDGTFIAYVSGIDTLGSVDVKRRSDVNILAAVNLNTGAIQLIDTPRDYFVILPQVGQADKLTHAGIYGIDYSIGALERLYGIKVNYYLRMNFTGFVKMIDTIGGVDVWSDYEFTVDPVKTYVVGENHLNGVEALAFARERYSFSSGDIQRGKNQMKVVNALISKLSSPEIIVNYAGILGAVSDSFQTNMPTDTMYSIISRQISTGTSWSISSRVSSGYGASSTTYSGPTKVGYVMTPNDDDVAAAHELFRAVVGN